MLPKQAFANFVARPREDVRGLKALSSEELTRMANADLEGGSKLWKKLRLHQRVCFYIGARRKRFAYTLDMGCGKTLIAIALARYFRSRGKVKHVLVLVPSRINEDEWAREILKHAPDTTYTILSGSSAEKWAALEGNDTLIYVTTYMGFVRMVSTPVGKHLKLNGELIRRAQAAIDGLICDEGHHIKDNRTLTFKSCHQLAKRKDTIVFTLTGTPFGREPTDIWAQIHLVDHGYSLGENLALFHGVFCKQKFNGFGWEWEFDRKKETQLNRYLAHSSIRYAADKADLPEVVHTIKRTSLGADAGVYYAQARQAIREARGNFRETKNAFIRMRQISSGFLGGIDDETGERVQVTFPTNPKLELLSAQVQAIAPEHKIVIFVDFIFSGDCISAELKRLGVGHERVYGATRDTNHALTRFNNDPTCRALVLSARMTEGLNLQIAKYGIFYESPVPVIARKQAVRRVERQASEHSVVFIIDLVVDDTVDEAILRFHKQGDDLFSAIIEGRALDLI